MSSYMAYKVATKTNVNYFKKSEMSVDRRFSDFLGLHDKLSEKYLPNGRIIPPAPDKSLVGMTKVKMSKEATTETAAQQDEVIIFKSPIFLRLRHFIQTFNPIAQQLPKLIFHNITVRREAPCSIGEILE